MVVLLVLCFFFKQRTAYELRISDWSSDVCSSDLSQLVAQPVDEVFGLGRGGPGGGHQGDHSGVAGLAQRGRGDGRHPVVAAQRDGDLLDRPVGFGGIREVDDHAQLAVVAGRSEEHTSELQSLMRISYAVFCLKKKKTYKTKECKTCIHKK